MGIISVILGVLLVIGGFSLMFTPLATFLATGYILGILLLVYGIAGIIRCISHKADALEWILNILAVIVGLIALFRPGSTLVFDSLILVIIACWFLVQGVVQIVLAFKEKSSNPNWFWGLIVGILAVIVGIICCVNPMVTALTAGILIGLLFVEGGISLIALGMAFGSDADGE